MKNKDIKHRVNQLLVQIHRGFLSPQDSGKLSDQEILSNVPENKTTYKALRNHEYEREARCTPFSYRWVQRQVKKRPTITAYDMLMKAGFTDQAEELNAS